jgi:2-desacetyl-2-hydroxyethyl bacteriochlorophyllide A dehydrogenase
VEALLCTEPGRLQLVQMPEPQAGPEAVLVRPRRVGICGTDYHIFQGKQPYLQYPRIMGHELAVEVVEAPSGSGFTPGELCVVNPYIACGSCVACRAGKPNCCVSIAVLGVHRDGGMAELLTLPARNLLHADGLGADQCAAVEFMAIGAHAVRRGGVGDGDRVLVVGAGPIGLGVALFARRRGASVTLYDRDPERVATAEAITGAGALPADGDVRDAAAAATGGEHFDVVFDATGNAAAMEQGFDLVAHGGRYVLVSIVKDAITFRDPDFHRKEMTLFASRNATSEDFATVIAAMRAGEVPVERLVTHRTSLGQAVHDIPVWATQKSGLIKAVVEIG